VFVLSDEKFIFIAFNFSIFDSWVGGVSVLDGLDVFLGVAIFLSNNWLRRREKVVF
jgi:hypothetical protein